MGKVYLIVVPFFLCCLSLNCYSKSWGNFKCYHQITDKEVLIETSNGAQILITAIDSQALQISASANKRFNLIPPKQISKYKHLEGSVYVEELDEMMQITTSSPKGIVISINKKPLYLTYISKENGNILLNESTITSKARQNISFEYKSNKNETLMLQTCKGIQKQFQNIDKGICYSPESIKAFSSGNNICLISSKSYSVLLESEIEAQIDLSEPETIKISKTKAKEPLIQFMLFLDTKQPELFEKYAQILLGKDRLISLN